MMVAGIPVHDRLVLELAGRLRDAGLGDAAETLEDAYYGQRRVAALTIPSGRRSCACSRIAGRAGRAPRRAAP
jgi:hypothetical protein